MSKELNQITEIDGSQAVSVFKNPAFGEVRVVKDEKGEPWLVGKDVATALGYKNFRDALKQHIDNEDKTDGVVIYDPIGRPQNPTCINESGLYALILSSKPPTAKQFKRWVTSEVLPSIRKHGTYMTDDVIKKTLADPDYLIELANIIKNERKQRQEAEAKAKEKQEVIEKQERRLDYNLHQIQQERLSLEVMERDISDHRKALFHERKENEELKKKVSYLDLILGSDQSFTVSQIAKDYGMSAPSLNQLLKRLRIQYKSNGQWLLYAKYECEGYTETETQTFGNPAHPAVSRLTRWTQKGIKFLYDTLKENGIIPTVEKS